MQKNYDHVGDCASGKCSGTFAHVRPLTKACALVVLDPTTLFEVGHNWVETCEE